RVSSRADPKTFAAGDSRLYTLAALSSWRQARAAGRFHLGLRLRGYLSRRAINTGAVALLDNRFRNSVREQFAIFPIARLVTLGAIAQISAFYQHSWTRCIAQHAKICCVHASICGIWDGHQFCLDLVRQIE